jgi:hypothetical protein
LGASNAFDQRHRVRRGNADHNFISAAGVQSLAHQALRRSFPDHAAGVWVGISLWLVYGFILRAAPIIATNAVTLALVLTLISFKIRYQRE